MMRSTSEQRAIRVVMVLIIVSSLLLSSGCAGSAGSMGRTETVTGAGVTKNKVETNAGVFSDQALLKKLKKKRKKINADRKDETLAVPFDEIDWSRYKDVLDKADYEVIERFLPILTEGKKFTWLDEDDDDDEDGNPKTEKKDVSLREMITENEYWAYDGDDGDSGEQEEWIRLLYQGYNFAIVDLFRTGSRDLVLGIAYLNDGKIILHEEKGVVYGILVGRRSLWGLQKDGIFGEGKYEDYCQMTFADGDYDLISLTSDGAVYTPEGDAGYEIGGKKATKKEFEKWKKKHISEEKQVEWYAAKRKDSAVDEYSQWRDGLFWMREPVSTLPVSEPSVTTEEYGYELPSVEQMIMELKFQIFMAYSGYAGNSDSNDEDAEGVLFNVDYTYGEMNYPVTLYYSEDSGEDKTVSIYCEMTRPAGISEDEVDDEYDEKRFYDKAESEVRCARMIYGEHGFELSIERIPMAEYKNMKLKELGKGELSVDRDELWCFSPELEG